jgi:alpha-beta hydrolase superfamily lysophospholipase
MISEFCRLRLVEVLNSEEREALSQYLIDLLELRAFPPYRGSWVDVVEVSLATGMDTTILLAARHRIQPVFDAVSRAVAMQEVAHSPQKARKNLDDGTQQRRLSREATFAAATGEKPQPAKRGPKPRPIMEFPVPLWTEWEEPETFAAALVLHCVGMETASVTSSLP